MSAYYNEHDPFAAAWVRELITAGEIAAGDVDERSIQDVSSDDVRAYAQCHFFAGIGGWSYALRLAGWPDDRPVWTGSCPCQPFSGAGARQGGADDRHLWPHWARLIRQCRPVAIFGEQVESAIAHGWLDAVFDDLERAGYACGPVCLPAASVGAFHARQRLWFVAESQGVEHDRSGHARRGRGEFAEHRRVGDTDIIPRSQGRYVRGDGADQCAPGATGVAGGVADTTGQRRTRQRLLLRQEAAGRVTADLLEVARCGEVKWADAEWIACRDGKARPVEPGSFPLAHGVPARVGRLRGYGNAIVPEVAAEVIRAYMEIRS